MLERFADCKSAFVSVKDLRELETSISQDLSYRQL